MADTFDFIVVGAGIAGASVAAELQREASVLVLEMERRPGYHTTGRSAAVFAEAYGPPPIRALTRASYDFFTAPPDGFAASPLLAERGALFVATATQMAELKAMHGELSREQPVDLLGAAEVETLNPLIRKGYATGGLFDPRSMDIDVNGLHQGYLRAFRAGGGTLATNARVEALTRAGGEWQVDAGHERYRAPVVVNAAGAWAEELGGMAGAIKTGLTPKRRTALLVAAPPGLDCARWPLTIDVEERFYLKPDAGRLLVSPANEDPEAPCDVQPDEMDIAICIDRIETAFDIAIRHIEHKWAGLRSFVADKAPLCGFDAQAEGFFWLAGQGGYGIQSAPALSRTAAALAARRSVPADILAHGLDPAMISPGRFAGA